MYFEWTGLPMLIKLNRQPHSQAGTEWRQHPPSPPRPYEFLNKIWQLAVRKGQWWWWMLARHPTAGFSLRSAQHLTYRNVQWSEYVPSWRKDQAYSGPCSLLTSMISSGLPRDKREGKASRQRRKLSAVTKLSAYLYTGTVAVVTSLTPSAQWYN